MKIGIPKEIKDHEFRVGATPSGVKAQVEDRETVYAAPLVVLGKEPQTSEFPLFHEGQVLFTYLHLALYPVQTQALIDRKVVAIAYETVTDKQGHLPLLVPMSEVAGRLAIQAGAHALQMSEGGRGVLLGGVAGVPQGKVVIVGGGIVGTQAARMAQGLGAGVTLLGKSLARLRALDDLFGPGLETRYSDRYAIAELVPHADLVVGAVLFF